MRGTFKDILTENKTDIIIIVIGVTLMLASVLALLALMSGVVSVGDVQR